jgi:hypothetical protein
MGGQALSLPSSYQHPEFHIRGIGILQSQKNHTVNYFLKINDIPIEKSGQNSYYLMHYNNTNSHG